MEWILIYLAFHCTICLYMSVRNGRRNAMMLKELLEREKALDATEAWLDRREMKLEERQRRFEVLVK